MLISFRAVTEQLRRANPAPPAGTIVQRAALQLEALAGQLRASVDLSGRTMPAAYALPREFEDRPLRARVRSIAVALIANLSLRSAACRHALRLAACIMVGDAIGRLLALPRSYWLPMTIAIVLKPDFSSTFVRGLARLAGTLIGLILATILFHLLPPGVGVEVVAIAMLTFILRCYGAANYVIFVTVVTALIVFMLALAGVRPIDAMAARGVNTALGGAIALLAYRLWPTWERHQVAGLMANMLEGYRTYFHAFRTRPRSASATHLRLMDRARLQSRLARSNMEASLNRLRVEPNTPPEQLLLLSGILANTYRVAHSLIAVEAHFNTLHHIPSDPAFERFAADVERMLSHLATSLRSRSWLPDAAPDLREDHRALTSAKPSNRDHDAYLILEADRLTNSLNTLAVELTQWTERFDV